jgi:hypothetical protein
VARSSTSPTSNSNGDSERILGEFLAADRKHFVLASKYGLSAGNVRISTTGASRKNMIQSAEASLVRRNTDYRDLFGRTGPIRLPRPRISWSGSTTSCPVTRPAPTASSVATWPSSTVLLRRWCGKGPRTIGELWSSKPRC